MKKFLKSFVLGLCSLSLFSCSGSHSLGSKTEQEETEGTEITFAEFVTACEEITDKATEKVDELNEISYRIKTYQDGELIKSQLTRIGGDEGFSNFHVIECSSDQPQKALISLQLTFALLAMPAFGPLVDEAYKKELEKTEEEDEEDDSFDAVDVVENGKFYKLEKGWLLKCSQMDIKWNAWGFPVSAEGDSEENGETYHEIDSFTYKYKTFN